MMNEEQIKQAWLEVFPNSHAVSRTVMGSTAVKLYLFPAKENYNRIQDNDPLKYTLWIEGENVKESSLSVLTRPPEGSNLAYESKRMRKQTIKNADYEKMVKRFRKVRDWIKTLDMVHDVSDKIQ